MAVQVNVEVGRETVRDVAPLQPRLEEFSSAVYVSLVRGFPSILGALLCWTLVPSADAESRYYFTDFEIASGWSPGPLKPKKSAFLVAQGRAVIAPVAGESGQALELRPSDPFGAVVLDASPVADHAIVWSETFVRPAALDESSSDEFLDFGGAVLGFFRSGDEGELCALSQKSAEESVWISTGLRFPLAADGLAQTWMRLTIRLNLKVGRWDLFVNGQPVLRGLRATARPRGLRLCLYGDKSRPVAFDDVLIANRSPEELEAEFPREQTQRRREMTPAPGRIGRQVVTKAKANAQLREAYPPLQTARGNVRLEDWHYTVKSGEQVYTSSPDSDAPFRLTAYTPAYDENGNPLPVTVTVTADARLEPGADLGDLRWKVSEVVGIDAQNRLKTGAVIQTGDFRTGLVQTITIPAEWTRKATSIEVWAESRR